MSVHVGAPARAPVENAPTALERGESRPSSGRESRAALAVLVAVQLGWVAALIYAVYRMVGFVGGFV